MKGYLLQQSALLQCPHIGGVAPLVDLAPRVLLAGQPAAVVGGPPMTVAGCPLQSQSPVFCTTGTFVAGTTRVLADGRPLAVSTSQATFAPTGATATARAFQTRVEAT